MVKINVNLIQIERFNQIPADGLFYDGKQYREIAQVHDSYINYWVSDGKAERYDGPIENVVVMRGQEGGGLEFLAGGDVYQVMVETFISKQPGKSIKGRGTRKRKS